MKRSYDKENSPTSKKFKDSMDNFKLEKRLNCESPLDDKKRYDEQREYYKSLCVRNLHSKLTNEVIENILTQEYKQFGEFNVKVAQFNGERVAYLNFKYSEHARAARYEKPKPIICERQCTVDPVLGSKYRHGPGQSEEQDRFRRVSSPRIRNDSDKRDKFPHHLSHIEPEDDPKATRTLFLGNLSSDIEESDIRDVFDKYGIIEDIDIKRPTKGTSNNSYAFVKYVNLDMAHKAKVHMSGKIIRGFQCKIGYGKVTPTKCLWVGGLGPWVQYDLLERIFSSFGTIVEIDWPLNTNYAYILFDNVEAAIDACDKLRGYCLGDTDRRIRLDFSDEAHVHNDPGAGWSNDSNPGTRPSRVGEISLICGDTYRFNNHQNIEASARKRSNSGMTLEKATMVLEMIKCMRHSWTGRFFLKNNYFGSRLYYLRGEHQMIDHFLMPNTPISDVELRIERKLILDNHLLDEVYMKITSAFGSSSTGNEDGICIMVAVAENLDPLITPDKENSNQKDIVAASPSKFIKRHLKALSAYLRIKQCAGKVTLQAVSDEANGFGVLHIFPPCSFSHKVLIDSAPLLTSDYGRDDFLLLILVRCY